MDGSSLSLDSKSKAVTYRQAKDPLGDPWLTLQPIHLWTLSVAPHVFIPQMVDVLSLS